MNTNSRLFELNVSFLLRISFTHKNGEYPIVLRLKYRGAKKDINTGLTVLRSNWVAGAYCVLPKAKNAAIINREIQEITHKCKILFQKMSAQYDEFSLDEFILRLKGNENPPETILEYTDKKIDELKHRVGIDLAKTTFIKYVRTNKYLTDFLNQKMHIKNIPVSRIDLGFLENFYKFLRKEKNNSNNSAVALLNCLKTILQEAVKNGTIRNNPFIKMSLTQNPVQRGYLNIEEIRQIECLTNLSTSLERYKDIFLFACYTGLSYSDIATLKSQHIIIEPDGSIHIEKYRDKTGILSYVPLLRSAENILIKHSSTGKCKDFNWYIPSNQKINVALKEIARLAKIEKNIFMHLARHTFATTVTLSNGVPLESVGKMIGHQGMKNLMIYAKIVNNKVKKDMEQVRSIF
jgi:site-specific recombinase XerD